MRGQWISYSPEELDWIERNARLPRSELHARFVEAWNRTDVSQANLHSLCKRKRWLTGRTGQFYKGQKPVNKGKTGCNHPNSIATRFKKGGRYGRAVEVWKPVGTERITQDGYLERKIHEGMPLRSRWRAVHQIRWEEANGPVPEGHALKCLDGDKTNTDPSNWEAIPLALLPRLNGKCGRNYDNAAPELKPVIMATTKLEHAAREARKRG